MRRVLCGTGVVLMAALFVVMGAALASEGIKLCIPKKEGSPIVTPKRGKCKNGFKLTALGTGGKEGKPGAAGKTGPEGKTGTTGFSSSELETLKSLLLHIKFVGAGVGGKPTIQFSGVNVQIVNGEGKTASTNGAGNLVIGYDEHAAKKEQAGSHDLVLGEEQEFASYGDLLAGFANDVLGPFESITGGEHNLTREPFSSVSGGEANDVNAEAASISGGAGNTAFGAASSVSGGIQNNAEATFASVTGGKANSASGEFASASGGAFNTASGKYASVSGGEENTAEGEHAWIGGGTENLASGLWAVIAGGGANQASGKLSSILGEKKLIASAEFEALK